MNERIRELYITAMREDCGEKWDEEFIARFAQLIVRECIRQALEETVRQEKIDQEDNIETLCYLRGNNDGINDAVIRIKQHFELNDERTIYCNLCRMWRKPFDH